MNPRERLLTTIRGKTADRVPLILDGLLFRSPAEVDDPARRKVVERSLPLTHFQVGCPSYVNRYMVTPPQRIRETARRRANGDVVTTCELDTPGGRLTAVTAQNATTNTVWTIKYPVESLEDLAMLRSVPWEPAPGLAPPDLSDLPEGFDERGIVSTSVSSPFVCVAGAMPYQYFLELCATERALIRELTAECLERILGVLDVVLADGTVDYVWVGGSEWLTPPMGSPALYRELVHEFERPIIRRAHEAGAVCHVHCHGNVRSTLELAIERGADFFEPVEPPPDGDITFAEAKALAAGRMTLGGNIEARVLERRSARAVEQAVRAAFEGGRHRMVLKTTAGPISAMTLEVAANYLRMVDVWEELSPI